MKFKTKMLMGVGAFVLIGVIGFFVLIAPKMARPNGVFFSAESDINARVTGLIEGNSKDVELAELTYNNNNSPTKEDYSSWKPSLKFGEEGEIKLTITIENLTGQTIYVSLTDRGSKVKNITKTITNDEDEYESGTFVAINSSASTTFIIIIQKDEEYNESIKYNYIISIKDKPEEKEEAHNINSDVEDDQTDTQN